MLEEQVREAGHFVSLMSRLVITYPNWACQIIAKQPAIDPVTRNRFQTAVIRNRKARGFARPADRGPEFRRTG